MLKCMVKKWSAGRKKNGFFYVQTDGQTNGQAYGRKMVVLILDGQEYGQNPKTVIAPWWSKDRLEQTNLIADMFPIQV